MRTLTAQETKILRELGSRMPVAQERQFLDDLNECKVEERGADASRLLFELAGYLRPLYKGQHAYPVEGTIRDQDGADVAVYVYADENGRLLELEFVKWADEPIKSLQWDSFKIPY